MPKKNGVAKLFDQLLAEHDIKTDAALAARMGVGAPVISKLRSGKQDFGPASILAIHETFGVPVSHIRKAAGQ